MKERTIVLKVGGELLDHAQTAVKFAEGVCALQRLGMKLVIVHGGGPQISRAMEAQKKKPVFVAGLRVTDLETVAITKAVLHDDICIPLLDRLKNNGIKATPIDTSTHHLFDVTALDKSLGFVGKIVGVNTSKLENLLALGEIPVISPIAKSASGEFFNINADSVAAEVAISLNAVKLIILSNISGLLRDLQDNSSLIREIYSDELHTMLSDHLLSNGMIPKATSILHALGNGVSEAHIIDGRIADVTLPAVFSSDSPGTWVKPQDISSSYQPNLSTPSSQVTTLASRTAPHA